MRAAVDHELCQGHARCWEICPEVFQLDEEGISHVPDPEVPPELEERVRQAVGNCPERAISIS